MSADVLIMAAGESLRFGGSSPKAYAKMGGEAVLRRSAERFLRNGAIDGVKVVLRGSDRSLYEEAVRGLDLLPPVEGGGTRQESVWRGLESLAERQPEKVLVHDAARPFVSGGLIGRVMEALTAHDAVSPALRISDAVKRAPTGGEAVSVVSDNFYAVQTPQGFRFEKLLKAHRQARRRGLLALRDDMAVVEAAGGRGVLMEGEARNMKITYAGDLDFPSVRVGHGFDAHRFCAGSYVTLGGVRIAHKKGLAGHSDADVVLHALADALLGLCGAGDLGDYFPSSDARWKDSPSSVFVKHAREIVIEKGGALINADVTALCGSPAIAPHRQAMRESIASCLGVSVDRTSVKATTGDGLLGVGGVAAHAVVSAGFW